ncbi:AMP-binding protein [Arenicella xantha]|uniref:Long-chain acyl-CoA synthetase n=1 Tax=Arenicella xantha TaxID=644221 RepID=A0A395JSI0_9GAMM|nr:AMP-binding protein [Arenicella xantha]RBP51660.1 long-chain acyl-CoA synthetase [Arenicella xantha]
MPQPSFTSEQKSQLVSVIERFYHWEETTPERVFLRQPVGDKWQTLSFAEAGQQARQMCAYLQSLGLQPGDHIGLLSKNCSHWILADLAILMGGFVSVPYYPSLPKAALAEVVKLSDIKALFIGKLDEFGDRAEAIDASVQVIRFPQYSGGAEVSIGVPWDQAIESHGPIIGKPVPELDSLWTIKFTSGTTGTPKGVMHSHRMPAMAMAAERETNWIGVFNLPTLKFLSYLPLNHVGERMGVEVPAIYCGGTLSFTENIDTFMDNIRQTQPNLFFGVPRIWTKFYLGIVGQMSVRTLNVLLTLPVISNILKKKIRTAIGMRDVQIAATGAAITPAFIKRFFAKLDIHLVEAYGMTEVGGSICNSPDPKAPLDSVGQVIPHGKVKIDPATQEVLMQTPYMMLGYYNDQAKTDQVLVDGWIHSGDRGSCDEFGFVRITGRVSDAFKTAKGSYVTPNPLEEALSANEFVEQVCVAGLGMPQPIALINLSEHAQNQPASEVEASIRETKNRLNESRAKFEQISTCILLNETWSEHNGLLTPTLKLRRAEIDNQYADRYSAWHEASADVIWE